MLLDNLQSWNRKCSPSNVHLENKVLQLLVQVRQISSSFSFMLLFIIIIIIIIIIIVIPLVSVLCQFAKFKVAWHQKKE